jgi:hypothetical protein
MVLHQRPCTSWYSFCFEHLCYNFLALITVPSISRLTLLVVDLYKMSRHQCLHEHVCSVTSHFLVNIQSLIGTLQCLNTPLPPCPHPPCFVWYLCPAQVPTTCVIRQMGCQEIVAFFVLHSAVIYPTNIYVLASVRVGGWNVRSPFCCITSAAYPHKLVAAWRRLLDRLVD